MRISVIIAISVIIFVEIPSINAAFHNRNVMRNIDKSIVKGCNKNAFFKTNNQDLYNCYLANKKDCNEIDGYNEYSSIVKDCIRVNREQCGAGVLFTTILWVGMGIFAMNMT